MQNMGSHQTKQGNPLIQSEMPFLRSIAKTGVPHLRMHKKPEAEQ